MSCDLRYGFRIGPWKVEPLIGAVTGPASESHHLEPKVMDVLVCLAEHPNELVSRDQLLETVWRGHAAADELLTRAISRIRHVLQNGSGDPKYIETVPKRGYRLIREVRPPEGVRLEKDAVRSESITDLSGRKRAFTILAVFALAFVSLTINKIAIDPPETVVSDSSKADDAVVESQPTVRPKSLTSMEGLESQPALSPNGSHVAFMWQKADSKWQKAVGLRAGDIYVMPLSGDAAINLTATEQHEEEPTWSPDGTRIAFLRKNEEEYNIDIIVKPMLGGPETRVVTVPNGSSLDWSPDGRFLAYSSTPPDELPRIFFVSTENGEIKEFTQPPAKNFDSLPAFSPDGQSLAFYRRLPNGGHICIQNLGHSEVRCITPEKEAWSVLSLDWAPDSQSVVAVVGWLSGRTWLVRVPTSAGNPIPLPYGDGAQNISIAHFGDRLVYSYRFQDHNLWRAPGPAAAETTNPTKLIAASTRDDFHPTHSPDGTMIVFMSARSAYWELWIATADGSNPRQLTHMGHAIFPEWSPDGRQIVFSSVGYAEGVSADKDWTLRPNKSDIYIIDASGGFPQNLTEDRYEDAIPSWSADGRWIYYQSRWESCGWQLWKRHVSTGEEMRLASCVLRPLEGPDGRVYFLYKQNEGIRSVPVDGGEPRLELGELGCTFYLGGWTVWERNLVYADCQDLKIKMLDLDSRETRELADVYTEETASISLGLDVSPDGKWIIYNRLDRAGSDLMLISPFQ